MVAEEKSTWGIYLLQIFPSHHEDSLLCRLKKSRKGSHRKFSLNFPLETTNLKFLYFPRC